MSCIFMHVLEISVCHLGEFDRWVGWSLLAGGHLVAGLDRWVGWLAGRTGLGRWVGSVLSNGRLSSRRFRSQASFMSEAVMHNSFAARSFILSTAVVRADSGMGFYHCQKTCLCRRGRGFCVTYTIFSSSNTLFQLPPECKSCGYFRVLYSTLGVLEVSSKSRAVTWVDSIAGLGGHWSLVVTWSLGWIAGPDRSSTKNCPNPGDLLSTP